MTTINVLSTGASVNSKEEGFSLSEKVQHNSDSAAMEFAAIFSGWVAQISGQGQNSGVQSHEPAGKEANSGQDAILGWNGLQALIGTIKGYGNPLEVPEKGVQGGDELGGLEQVTQVLNQGMFEQELLRDVLGQSSKSQTVLGTNIPVSLNSTEFKTVDSSHAQTENWTREATLLNLMDKLGDAHRTEKPEQSLGRNSLQSELDLYKVVISELLKDMSGEIQEGIRVTPEALNTVQQKLEVALQRMDTSIPVNFFLPKQGRVQDLGSDESLVDQLKSRQPSGGHVKGNREFSPFIYQRELVNLTLLQQPISDNLQESKDSSQLSIEEKDVQNLVTENTGILNQTKDSVHNSVRFENKTDLPIWAQVARDIHEKAFKTRPHIKDLEIQLHPAELGQIRLSLTWEDGRVHMKMSASEHGTGQILQSNLTELRDNLSQLGIQCGMIEMGLGDQQKNSRQHKEQEAQPQFQNNPEDSRGIQNITELESLSGSDLIQSQEASNRINVTA
jgi:flagellar hook-length control protein FliK